MNRVALVLVLAFAASPALAGSVSVTIDDTNGAPAANAVVELVSNTRANLPTTHVADEAIIDQRHETFIPLVSLIRRGGHVVFTNNDTTKHQVYSFSAIKQFEFEIDQGERSAALTFDTPGVSAIGCNIHDQMITYVYVADSPFAAVTNAKGRVQFNDVPAGAYHTSVWHPQLMPGKPVMPRAVVVSTAPVAITIPISLIAVSMSGMKHTHMGKY